MKKNAIFAAEKSFDVTAESSSLSSGTLKTAKIAPFGAILGSPEKNGVKNGLLPKISFKNFRALCMANRKLKLFKEPKIIRCKNGDWYIAYYYRDPENPAKWVGEYRERAQLNYIKDPAEKEKAFEELRQDVRAWLSAGNSPFDAEEQVRIQVEAMEARIGKEQNALRPWTMAGCRQSYFDYLDANAWKEETKEGFSHDTVRTYKIYVNALVNWCNENDLGDKPVWKFNEFDLEAFLGELADERDWGGRTYNNYLDYYGNFFNKVSLLENRERLKQGYEKFFYQLSTDGIDRRKVTMQRNKPFTEEQKRRIKEALKKPGRENLRDYCEFIYLGFMRPKEIRALKTEKIETHVRQIRLVGKTGDRLVPMSDQLLALVNKRIDHKGAAYLFGYSGAVDERRMSVAYFLEQFDEVRKEANIPPELGPYNFKHTGVRDMLLAGFSEEETMTQTGHKTKEAFRAYIAGFNIDHSHPMKGSTIEF
jgi:integrase